MDTSKEQYLVEKLAGKLLKSLTQADGSRLYYPEHRHLDRGTPLPPWSDEQVMKWFPQTVSVGEETYEEWKQRKEQEQ